LFSIHGFLPFAIALSLPRSRGSFFFSPYVITFFLLSNLDPFTITFSLLPFLSPLAIIFSFPSLRFSLSLSLSLCHHSFLSIIAPSSFYLSPWCAPLCHLSFPIILSPMSLFSPSHPLFFPLYHYFLSVIDFFFLSMVFSPLPSLTSICHCSLPSVIALSLVPSPSPICHCELFSLYHHNLYLINQWNVVAALLGRCKLWWLIFVMKRCFFLGYLLFKCT
jgi:hypothetical protein